MRRSPLLRCALALAIVLGGGSLAVRPAAADTVGDQQQQVKAVVAELDRMHQKVDQYNEEYLSALNDKAAVEAQIAVSQQRIAQQQASLSVLQSQLANVAIEQFMGGGSGALGPLFTDPAQIDDGLQRQHLSTVVVNAGAASTDDYETLLTDLAKEEKSLEKQQAQAAGLAQKAEASRIKAESAANDLQARLVVEQAKLGDLIAQEEQRQADAAAAAFRQQQAAAAAKSAASAPAAASSGSGSNASSSSGNGSGSSGSGTSGGGASSGGSSSGGGSGSAASSSGSSGGGSSSGDTGGSSSPPPPVSSRASAAISAAASQLGVPYQFAQSSPGVAFDCSGLTAYAWAQAGVNLPHQSAAQYASTPHVPKDQAQPGDLIFYYSPVSHVGIYVGGGQMIHAPQSGSTVSYASVRWDKVIGVGRPG